MTCIIFESYVKLVHKVHYCIESTFDFHVNLWYNDWHNYNQCVKTKNSLNPQG